MSIFCGTWNRICMPCWSDSHEKQNDLDESLLRPYSTSICNPVPSPDTAPPVVERKEDGEPQNKSRTTARVTSDDTLTSHDNANVPVIENISNGNDTCMNNIGTLSPGKVVSNLAPSETGIKIIGGVTTLQEISYNVSGNNNTVIHAGIGLEDRALEILSKHSEHGARLSSSFRSSLLESYEGHKTFLDDAMNWIADPDSQSLSEEWRGRRMLWLSGPAGVGKSAFAQRLGDMCIKNNMFGGGFFFSGQNNFNLPLTVFPTIAYQLFTTNATYRMNVTGILRSDPAALQTNLQFQFQNLIVNPLTGITLPDQKRLVIIIDGLDECANARSQHELTQLISGALRPTDNNPELPVLWVVCTRNTYNLSDCPEDERKDFPNLGRFHAFELDSKESKEDVTRFIHQSLGELYRRYDDITEDKWPGPEAINVLCDVSSGLIAFPATLFRYVDDIDTRCPDVLLKETLEEIARGRQKENIEAEPWTGRLDRLYTRILDDISKRKKLLQDSLWILETLAIAEDGDHLLQSNNMQQYSNLLGLNHARLKECLGKLHAVLKIPTNPNKYNLSFHHASFPDFLRDPRRSCQYTIDDTRTKGKIFSRVLEILRSDTPLVNLGIAANKLNTNKSKDVNETKEGSKSADEPKDVDKSDGADELKGVADETKDVDVDESNNNADESKDAGKLKDPDESKVEMYKLIRSCLTWPHSDAESGWQLAKGVYESAIRTFFLLLNDNPERQQNFNFNLVAYLICGWRIPVTFLFAIGRTMNLYDSRDRRLSRLRKQYYPTAVPMSPKWLKNAKTKPCYICLGHAKNSVLVIVLPATIAEGPGQNLDQMGFIASQEPHELWPHVFEKTDVEYSTKLSVFWPILMH